MTVAFLTVAFLTVAVFESRFMEPEPSALHATQSIFVSELCWGKAMVAYTKLRHILDFKYSKHQRQGSEFFIGKWNS